MFLRKFKLTNISKFFLFFFMCTFYTGTAVLADELSLSIKPVKEGAEYSSTEHEDLRVILVFRNHTNNDISFSYMKPVFWYPVIRTWDKKEIVFYDTMAYNGPSEKVTQTVRANGTLELSSSSLLLREKGKSTPGFVWYAEPGVYEVTYELTFNKIEEADWQGKLVTLPYIIKIVSP